MKLVAGEGTGSLSDLETGSILKFEKREAVRFWGRTYSPEKHVFTVTLPPHSFKALRID